MLNTTNAKKLIERILASKCEVVKIGADVHARDVVVCLQLDGAKPERPMKMSAEQLEALASALVKAGLKVHVCQETGPCGFGLHRRLLAAGAHSVVVVATALSDGRQQKTDGLDAAALLDKLDRYLRGNTKAFTTITVPTPEQEQDRARGRLREELKHSRHEWEARGRSRLLAQGYHVTGPWWHKANWLELAKALPAWLVTELEAAAPAQLPKAVGALTWVLLAREICDWSRFKNRRQVASYTGLCPGVHQSGTTQRDGHINRHGNPLVRHLLIQLVWRLVRYQPTYPSVAKLVGGVVKGAARRKLAVAAVRRLGVDLWRLATAQTTPEKLHLLVPST